MAPSAATLEGWGAVLGGIAAVLGALTVFLRSWWTRRRYRGPERRSSLGRRQQHAVRGIGRPGHPHAVVGDRRRRVSDRRKK